MPDAAFLPQLERDGYFLFKNFFTDAEIATLAQCILPAHENWLRLNAGEAVVNSNYLTSRRYMADPEARRETFRLIASEKLIQIARPLCPRGIYYLNTQLFFNPVEAARKPYWHRDVQYLGVDETAQQQIIKNDVVLHFRIPFSADPGLEFIPGSHRRWDSLLERMVRLEKDGHKNSEDLPEMVRIGHDPGDLLVFSAHLIHRGSYGLARQSLDILYTDFPERTQTAARFQHFPYKSEFDLFEHGEIFRTV